MKTIASINVLYAISILLISLTLQSQPIGYFHKIYIDSISNWATASIPCNNGFISICGQGGVNYSNLFFRQTDLAGNIIDEILIDEGPFYIGVLLGTQFIRTNNGYILVYQKNPIMTASNPDIVLIKTDTLGQIIWQRVYESPLYEQPAAVSPTSDGGYFISGARFSSSGSGYYLGIKTDSLGILEWERTAQLDDNSVALWGGQTPDGGYLLSGYGYDEQKDYESYFVKLSPIGQIQWESQFGTNIDDGGCRMLITEDNSYMVWGVIHSNAKYQAYIGELNPLNGAMLWHKKYAKSDVLSSAAPLLPLPDGGFMAGAIYYGSDVWLRGMLLRFDSEGDTLWSRSYTALPTQENYVRDLDSCPDGGYLLTGFTYNSPQKSWLVKTDSLGVTCSWLGCDSLSSVPPDTALSASPPSAALQYGLSVWPNPVAGLFPPNLHVQYHFPLTIPCGHICLYASDGRLCLKKPLHSSRNEADISLEALPSGCYVWQVLLGGHVVDSGQVVRVE